MKKKMLFIYNAHEEKARIRSKLVEIIEVFVQAGYEMTVMPMQKQGDAITFVQEKEEYFELVVCSGSDVTLAEAITGMLQCKHKVSIGYVPCGSTNDFARGLKIPSNMVKAAHTAAVGDVFACDVGRFNGETFLYAAAFALFTDVSCELRREMKSVHDRMLFLLEKMKRQTKIKSYHLKVRFDGVEIEDDFVFGTITNSRTLGGFRRITGQDVALDDGLFEVILVKLPKGLFEIRKTQVSLRTRIVDPTYIYCFKTSKVTFEATEEIPWTWDGESDAFYQKVEIENLNKALEIKIPPKK